MLSYHHSSSNFPITLIPSLSPTPHPCRGLSPHSSWAVKREVIKVVFKQIGVVFAVRGTMKSRHTESDSGKDLIWVESGGAERENDQGAVGVEPGGVCGAGAEKARRILCGLGSCQIIIFQMLEGEGEKQEEWREENKLLHFSIPLCFTFSALTFLQVFRCPLLASQRFWKIKGFRKKTPPFYCPPYPPACVWPHVSRQRSKTKKAHLSLSQLPLHNS